MRKYFPYYMLFLYEISKISFCPMSHIQRTLTQTSRQADRSVKADKGITYMDNGNGIEEEEAG